MAEHNDEFDEVAKWGRLANERGRENALLRAENERLRAAIRDAERAILGDGTVEADLRLHEALAPLWAALFDRLESDG